MTETTPKKFSSKILAKRYAESKLCNGTAPENNWGYDLKPTFESKGRYIVEWRFENPEDTAL